MVGAHGVIGSNLIDHLAGTGGLGGDRVSGAAARRAAGCAMSPSTCSTPTRHPRQAGGLTDVTHVFYAAYQDRPTWAELVAPNVAMLTQHG